MNDPKLIPQKLNKIQRNKAKKNLGKRYLRMAKSSLEEIIKIVNKKEYLNEKDINKINLELNWLSEAEKDLKTDQKIDYWYEVCKQLFTHGVDDQSDFTSWGYCHEMFKEILEKAWKSDYIHS